MKECDVLVVGASTTGCWVAKHLAQKGLRVFVVEKQKEENVSRSYDIFHMGKKEMEKFALTIPQKGDTDYAFEYVGGAAYSAYGNYPKPSYTEVVGMHKHDYIMRMTREARAAGAQFCYDAPFCGFLFDENGKICGATYGKDEAKEIRTKIVADCSGIPSAARTKLPDGYGVENAPLSPRDMFYVIVNYVRYTGDREPTMHTDSYLQYKAWTAPSGDPHGGIVGIGANLSFDYALEMFREFRKNVALDNYEIIKTEKGATPYRRPPYSFVADRFIAMGDAACLTKPNNGEGCTSSLYQAKIAVDVISDAINEGKDLSTDVLWKINKDYVEVQGKSFASMQAMLTGAACIAPQETEYLFSHDVVFSKKVFAGLSGGISFTPPEIAKMLHYIFKGIANGTIRKEFCKAIIEALKNGLAVAKHYEKYPETPEGFEAWCQKADKLWEKAGSMADSCDKKLLERIEKRKQATL